jgi:endonuclease/exonuclease/phosphatase family metal-dependent hydrolase
MRKIISFIDKVIFKNGNLLFYLFVITCFLHQINSNIFIIDLIGNLGKQIFIGGILLFVILIFLKRYLLSLASVLVLIIFAIKSLYPCDNCTAVLKNKLVNDFKLRLMTFNTEFYRSSDDLEKIEKAILSENIDIILFQEVSINTLENLKNLKSIFPHGTNLNKPVNFWGSVILSKIPLENSELDNHVNESTLVLNNEKITILGVHLFNPVTQEFLNLALNQLDYLKTISKKTNNHLIIIGDLNMTSTSRRYINFIKETNLFTYSSFKNITSTWPSFLPNLLGIQIDHIIFSEKFKLKQKKTLKNFASDHRPIIFELYKD